MHLQQAQHGGFNRGPDLKTRQPDNAAPEAMRLDLRGARQMTDVRQSRNLPDSGGWK